MSEKCYHFIGIGGIGMSALARILLQQGKRVSGSDISSNSIIESLKNEGAQIVRGHFLDTISKEMIVIYSSAVKEDNPEYKQALELKLPVLHRSELLKELMAPFNSLLVAGTHGKTTTSSLLAHVLIQAKEDCSYVIGGIPFSLGTNGKVGKGGYFVAEADESDGSFLNYGGFGAIITNIDNDHFDYWNSEEALLKGFKNFASKISSKRHLFFCSDDEKLHSLKLDGVSYGFGKRADLRLLNYHQKEEKSFFNFSFDEKLYSHVSISLIGIHNALNAAAVFGLALRLGILEESIRKAFETFRGVGRRSEKKGEVRNIAIYDDYAHHPTEVLVTLQAMKEMILKKRLIVAFQPHRYSRVKECMEQFRSSFKYADILILTDIYAAGESPMESISTEIFVEAVRSKAMNEVLYVPRQDLVLYLHDFLRDDDVLVTMGAGDITKIGSELLHLLRE